MKLRRFFLLTNTAVLAAMIILSVFGTYVLYVLVYIAVFLMILVRSYLVRGLKRVKLGLTLSYAIILVCQIVFATHMLVASGGEFYEELEFSSPASWARRIVCSIVIMLPVIIARYVIVGKYAEFYLPSVREAGTIGFSEFRAGVQRITGIAGAAKRKREKLTAENVRSIFGDLPRHNSLRYINGGTLTEDYFDRAGDSLDDPHIYIILSSTGSAANEVISVFTSRLYNHASLSFDRSLETALSYNGGANLYPPGLNPEMISHFAQKKGASLLVYSLVCTAEQKRQILERIREINDGGSAYNMLGLVTKHSYRPNIMFCSQFVYRMLVLAGLAYFEKHDGRVEPTDFITEDYYRALAFEYELEL